MRCLGLLCDSAVARRRNASTFGVRSLAITFGWSLPVFREPTKRERWKGEPKDSTKE